MINRFILPLGAALSLAGCVTADLAPSPATSAPVSAPVAAPVAAQAIALAPDTVPGMVSSADPRTTQAGVEILRQGGNATDAAIAVMLALTVVEPQSSGIGGGGFFLRADAKGYVASLDGRETAPSGATPAWFLGADGEPLGYNESVLSGLSIGVPGNIALAAQAHATYGKLSWADLFQPAIKLARDGFVMTGRFHEFLDRFRARAGATPEGMALYFGADREPLPVGTLIRNPALGDTLERLANGGPEAFYQGALAAELAGIVAADTPREGAMTVADIGAYEAIWRHPVCRSYRDHAICSMGPPSSGATTVLAMLGQLEQYDLAALGPNSATSWHLFIESQRLAYADRELFLADSDFIRVPVQGLVDRDYLAQRGALMAPDARLATVTAGSPRDATTELSDGDEPEEAGTSHLVTTDRWGAAVSYTSTIEGPFGSGRMAGGFYLNNELTDFSRSPQVDGRLVANRVEGGKRPRSSMSPTIVFGPDGEIRVAIGAAGGATIPVQVTKALIGMIDWGMSAQEAIALPIVYGPNDQVTIYDETDLLALQGELEALGHTISARRLPLKANAIEWRDGRWIGAADPRSEGVALGQ